LRGHSSQQVSPKITESGPGACGPGASPPFLQAGVRAKGEVVQDWGADAAGDDLPRAEAQYAALWAERRRITHRLHTDTQRQVLADLTPRRLRDSAPRGGA